MFRRIPSRRSRGRPAALEIVFGVGCGGISRFFFRLFFFERTRPAASMYQGKDIRRKNINGKNFRMCIENNVEEIAKYSEDRTPLRCSNHKLENDCLSKSKRCIVDGCNKQPFYGCDIIRTKERCGVHRLESDKQGRVGGETGDQVVTKLHVGLGLHRRLIATGVAVSRRRKASGLYYYAASPFSSSL